MKARTFTLTARQHELLTYLHSRAPAMPARIEMARALATRPAAIAAMLQGLELRGHVRILPNLDRGVELLRKPPPPSTLPQWTRDQGLAFARAWRIRMKPYFDALYAPQGAEG